jgi:hypothetical protein
VRRSRRSLPLPVVPRQRVGQANKSLLPTLVSARGRAFDYMICTSRSRRANVRPSDAGYWQKHGRSPCGVAAQWRKFRGLWGAAHFDGNNTSAMNLSPRCTDAPRAWDAIAVHGRARRGRPGGAMGDRTPTAKARSRAHAIAERRTSAYTTASDLLMSRSYDS